jgi:F-type H+-transporting ATPase subunit delta
MPDLMRGASRQSLAAARARLDQALADPSAAEPQALGEELFSFVDVLDAQPALRAALTDPGGDSDSKAALATELLSGKVSGTTMVQVEAAARSRWSAARDLGDALADLAVQALATSAERRGALDAVEDDVFRFTQIVAGSGELRAALADRIAPSAAKAQLVGELLQGKAASESRVLLSRVVAHPRGRSLEDGLADLEREVAERRRRLTATVVSAVPLSDAQRERLAVALSAQRGTQVHLNVVVDPDVVGGLRVTIDDEVVDGTLANRLEEARRRFGG